MHVFTTPKSKFLVQTAIATQTSDEQLLTINTAWKQLYSVVHYIVTLHTSLQI